MAFDSHELRVCVVRCTDLIAALHFHDLQPIRRGANEVLSMLLMAVKAIDAPQDELHALSADDKQAIYSTLRACAAALVEMRMAFQSYSSIADLRVEDDTKKLMQHTVIDIQDFAFTLHKVASYLDSALLREVLLSLTLNQQLSMVRAGSDYITRRLRIVRELVEIFKPTSDFRQALSANSAADAPTTPDIDQVLRETKQSVLLQEAMRVTSARKSAVISSDKEADDALRQTAMEKIGIFSSLHNNSEQTTSFNSQTLEQVRLPIRAKDRKQALSVTSNLAPIAKLNHTVSAELLHTTTASKLPVHSVVNHNIDNDRIPNGCAFQAVSTSARLESALSPNLTDLSHIAQVDGDNSIMGSSVILERSASPKVESVTSLEPVDHEDANLPSIMPNGDLEGVSPPEDSTAGGTVHIPEELEGRVTRDEVAAILTQLNPDNCDVIVDIIWNLFLKDRPNDQILAAVVRTVFETACENSARSGTYATLLSKLCDASRQARLQKKLDTQLPSPTSGLKHITAHLKNICQEICDNKRWLMKNQQLSTEAHLDLPIVLGALYSRGTQKQKRMLCEARLLECATAWLDTSTPSTVDIARLYKLMQTVGQKLDSSATGNLALDRLAVRIKAIRKDPNVPHHSLALLRSLIITRAAGWKHVSVQLPSDVRRAAIEEMKSIWS